MSNIRENNFYKSDSNSNVNVKSEKFLKLGYVTEY